MREFNVLQTVIPLPLYVSVEIVKLGQVYFINNDAELYYEPIDKRMECRALNITEDLGQIEYIFSDKTGTLTENQMEFKSCTIGGTDYPHTPGKNCTIGGRGGGADYPHRPGNTFTIFGWGQLILPQ